MSQYSSDIICSCLSFLGCKTWYFVPSATFKQLLARAPYSEYIARVKVLQTGVMIARSKSAGEHSAALAIVSPRRGHQECDKMQAEKMI